MFQKHFGNTSRFLKVLQEYFRSTSGVLQEYFRSILVVRGSIITLKIDPKNGSVEIL
ncbi:MAG: hypothetical protein WBI78_02850 [Methanosarcina flavescens]|jgi:hypothetical protein